MSALTKRMSSLLKTKKKPPQDLTASLEKKEDPAVRAPRLVKEFCDASSEDSSAADEVIYLPYIREAVEASPQAAKGALKALSKYLAASTTARPGALYNAVMLLRILTDSPGPSFTQHFDERFVGTVRIMLQNCNRQEPQLILQQTLEYFQREKNEDQNLTDLVLMWQAQKNEWQSMHSRRQQAGAGAPAPQIQHPQPSRFPTSLPPAEELVERIAEADTSVQLLTQFLQTTPQEELLGNELIREFTNRCKSARDSMQAYIDCQNPEPDGDTLMTLVTTQQKISAVLNKRNVAVSKAKAALGVTGNSNSPSPAASRSTSAQNAVPTTATAGILAPTPQPAVAANPAARLENPFDDANEMNLNGAANGRRSPASSSALGGNRSRPALNVNTLFGRRKQGQKDANAKAKGGANGALDPAPGAPAANATAASAAPATTSQPAVAQEAPKLDNSIDGSRFVV